MHSSLGTESRCRISRIYSGSADVMNIYQTWQKWWKSLPNVTVRDVVVVNEADIFRNECKMGRVLPPTGKFVDVYARKRWKRVHDIAELVWQRWCKEYLESLAKMVETCAECDGGRCCSCE